jgi:2-aminoadipate transaminase
MYRSALDRAFGRHGTDALVYGANAGPLPVRSALARWSAQAEQADCDARHVFLTAGATHGLDLLCTRLGDRGAVVLVQRTTYAMALDLFRDRGMEPVPVGEDLAVPTGAEFENVVRSLRAAGRTIAFAYLVPTFHNPTGASLSVASRMELLEAARGSGVILVEDDPYRLLYFQSRPPPSLVALSGWRGVIGVRTLSKILAPGVRTGFLLADGRWLRGLGADPLFRSGGGIAHIAGLATSEILGTSEFEDHMLRVRGEYLQRCEALLRALAPARSLGIRWNQPDGGFFAWLKLPAELPATRLRDAALKRNVRVLPGLSSFAAAPREDDSWVRLAFSLYPAKVLASAGEQLAAALPDASQCKGFRYEHD